MVDNQIQHRHRLKRNGQSYAPLPAAVSTDAAFGYPRDFLDNQFVYLVISPRAGGLSIGVNVNPIMTCNFHCVYCEVDRALPARAAHFDVDRMALELNQTLNLARSGGLRKNPRYACLPEDLLKVRHVALSGDGEPTLASHFVATVQAVAHARALRSHPFKIVLLTNSSALDKPHVQEGLALLTQEDEIWTKLEAGTQEYFELVNGSAVSLDKITDNILQLGRRRPVVIQSLFPAINGAEPPASEIEQYALRLKRLKQGGARISLVQIYSATRPMARVGGGHLPLKTLSLIARAVRHVAGLQAEVF